MASAIPGLPVSRGLLPGPPVRQARSAQAWAEVSTVGCGLLHSMKILTAKFPAGADGAGREAALKMAQGVVLMGPRRADDVIE